VVDFAVDDRLTIGPIALTKQWPPPTLRRSTGEE
jgi:hypothetical protein